MSGMNTVLDGVSNYNNTNANSDRSPGLKNGANRMTSMDQASDAGFAKRPRLNQNNPMNPAAMSMNFGSKTPGQGNTMDIFNGRQSNISANLDGT